MIPISFTQVHGNSLAFPIFHGFYSDFATSAVRKSRNEMSTGGGAYRRQNRQHEAKVITEVGIKAALKGAPASGKRSIELRDEGERGAGRLTLLIRLVRKGMISEWYVVWYRNEKRRMLKIGTYPLMPLATARKTFREEYAPAISAGGDPTSKHIRRRHKGADGLATVTELFRGYADHLKACGKRSWKVAERVLLSEEYGVAPAIGAHRTAASVTPADIVAHLAGIYDRGAVAMADNTRAWIRSAFAWGLRSANDYKKKDGAADWGIKLNPAEAIQADPDARKARDRFLTPAEVKALWDWLVANTARSKYVTAVQLLIITGQRVEEILRVSDKVYLPAERMFFWDKTKNKLPHAIPLSPLAVSVLDSLRPNQHGLYFPNRDNPGDPASHTRILDLVSKYVVESGAARFTPRDLRRTFKTLAGDAGISKEMRDRLQNHVMNGDVSTRHYDRYDYLTQKREAVAQWTEYLGEVLAGKIAVIGERTNVVSFKAPAGA
jgi:integrase